MKAETEAQPLASPSLALSSLLGLFGYQILRLFFSSLAWHLRDTLGFGSLPLAGIAFGTVLLGLLAIPFQRAFGIRRALAGAAAALIALRALELISRDPSLDLTLALLGTVTLCIALPLLFAFLGQRAPDGPVEGTMGMLLGLALDSALRGLFGTLDLSWSHLGSWTMLAFIPAAVWALWGTLHTISDTRAARGLAAPASPIALGGFLLLQFMMFQNQGWVAVATDFSPPAAAMVVSVGATLIIFSAVAGLRWRGFFNKRLGAVAGLALAFSGLAASAKGTGFLALLLLAQLAAGYLWGRASRVRRTTTFGRLAADMTGGLLLLLLMAFLYYAGLDLPLPIDREAIPPIGGALFALPLLLHLRAREDRLPPLVHRSALPLALLSLAATSFVFWIPRPTPLDAGCPPPAPGELRVMTYNIHSAFNSAGAQDPMAITQAIADACADVVGLQEISRGWLIDGSTDLAAFLERHLRMRVIFQGTTDALWGNAILTRLPVLASGSGSLPLAGTRLPRGFLWAELDDGHADPLLVIATHLHHVEAENEVRLAQVPVLLNFWGGRSRTVMMGDLNAEPGYPEIEMIADSGLIDSWEEAGLGPGLTWPAWDPFERIDWIWHTPDFSAQETYSPSTTASDHRPVIALLRALR